MEEKGCSATAFSHNLGKVTGSSFATVPRWLMSTAGLPEALPIPYCLRTRFSKTIQTP